VSGFKLSQHFIFGNILSWKNRFQQSKAASAAFGTLDGSREAIVEQFPGNISDLASVIEYSIVMTSGQKVGVYDLPEYLKNIHAGPEPEEQCPRH
jgi:transcriptional regulator of acetoin/glycerol metabolism